MTNGLALEVTNKTQSWMVVSVPGRELIEEDAWEVAERNRIGSAFDVLAYRHLEASKRN